MPSVLGVTDPVASLRSISADGSTAFAAVQFETTQSILTLFLAVRGGYLCLFLFVSKRRRERRTLQARATAEARAVA